MPHVLRALQDVRYGYAVPCVRLAHVCVGAIHAVVVDSVVVSGAIYLLLFQNARDLIGPVTFHRQLENAADNGCSFLIDKPVIPVLRVFAVAIDAQIVGWQARVALLVVACPHLPRLVAQIHLVKHVHKRRKLAADRVDCIHAVADGNKADVLLTEIDFGVKTCLDVIATHAAEILGDDDANLARVNVHDELFPSGTVKVAAAVAVVRVVPAVGEAIPGSVFGQVAFLIGNGQRFVCLFIVSGKTLIQRSDSLSGVLVLCLTLIHDLSPLLRASIGSPTPIGQTPGYFGTVFATCEKEIDILLFTNYNL